MQMSEWASFVLIGFILIIVGSAIIFLAIVISGVKTKSKTRGAGIILIGPFPIIIGTDKESLRTLLILTIIAIALMSFFLLLNFCLT